MPGFIGYLVVVFACLSVHGASSTPLSNTPLIPRVNQGDPLYNTGAHCNPVGPDADLTALGVRIGLYLQCFSLALAGCTGFSRALAAVPASLITGLVYNIVLSMKMSQVVFQANPVVQDFWVTQGQLFLLTTTLPMYMLFGKWESFGFTKNTLLAVTILYTYSQSFWFWLVGYRESDEIVCDTDESHLFGEYALFSGKARCCMVVMYSLGVIIILLAAPNYFRGKNGILSSLIRQRRTTYTVKAAMVFFMCSWLYVVMILLVESVVRRGRESGWVKSTGQWLGLGLGVFTVIEALWGTLRAAWREIVDGGQFSENPEFLGGTSGSYTEVEQKSSGGNPLLGSWRQMLWKGELLASVPRTTSG